MPSIALNQKTSGRWPPGILQYALYIRYRVQGDETRTLTDVGSEEIDGLALKTYGIVNTDILL